MDDQEDIFERIARARESGNFDELTAVQAELAEEAARMQLGLVKILAHLHDAADKMGLKLDPPAQPPSETELEAARARLASAETSAMVENLYRIVRATCGQHAQ